MQPIGVSTVLKCINHKGYVMLRINSKEKRSERKEFTLPLGRARGFSDPRLKHKANKNTSKKKLLLRVGISSDLSGVLINKVQHNHILLSNHSIRLQVTEKSNKSGDIGYGDGQHRYRRSGYLIRFALPSVMRWRWSARYPINRDNLLIVNM